MPAIGALRVLPAFGDASVYGSMGNKTLNAPIMGIG